MGTPWNLDELEIVGYANVLKETMLPSVVAPVFRLKADLQRAFLPPFSLNGGYLCNAAEVTESEPRELASSGEITLFDQPCAARAGYDLWVDQSFQWHYEPREDVRQKLHEIAVDATRNAEEALGKGDLDGAERFSGVAISADGNLVKPLVIKAAIRRIKGNPAGERLMAKLASRVMDQGSFSVLVERYYALHVHPVPAKPPKPACSPMRGIACEHAA